MTIRYQITDLDGTTFRSIFEAEEALRKLVAKRLPDEKEILKALLEELPRMSPKNPDFVLLKELQEDPGSLKRLARQRVESSVWIEEIAL